MTRLLYETDPYLSRFDSTVVGIQGEWVILDRTAFFPGGGGQDADTGWLGGFQVTEVKGHGEDVLHRVPGHSFAPGSRVDCEVDWERRHDLMRGHTGEHLLFSVLSKINPDLELVKIAITPAKKSLIIKGEVGWSLLTLAQEEANEAIAAQLPVSEVWVSKDSDLIKDVRIKVERIHGGKVRIVKIGEIDKAACAGVHIQNTRELRMLLVTKLTSARPAGDYEIEFETGKQAMQSALRLSSISLQASDAIKAQPDDLVNALSNLKNELQIMREAMKNYGRQTLRQIEPEKVEGIRLYSGAFEGLDKKMMVDSANEFVRNERSAVIMAALDERLLMIVAASKDIDIDCREVLAEGLKVVGGRGGGGKSFASGGAGSPQGAMEAIEAAKSSLKARLSTK